MSDETPVDPYCEAWPGYDSIVPINAETSPDPRFYIKFSVEYIYPQDDYGVDDDFADFEQLSEAPGRDIELEVCEPCHRLTDESTSWAAISDILTALEVPLDNQAFMIHRISACAREMASAPSNVGRKLLPMHVSIGVVVLDYDREDAAPFKAVPASESSIEAVEEVKVFDSGDCGVCLEGLEIACEAARMPCSHLYHGGCIRSWLRAGETAIRDPGAMRRLRWCTAFDDVLSFSFEECR
ncbi:hypothetical protein RJ639_012636 [Escallonia herrerae]|uniref:RING-type E3 ubiquitin transferase n=1 Tax=Escallonia herrerae TaxID=1293975 RepID=A0AA88VMC7_9ASTE|nr:hypothetical protein RJ639_012636 [Escallonia herrerae]